MPPSRTEWWKDGFEDEENDWYIVQDVIDLDFYSIQPHEKQPKTAHHAKKIDAFYVSKAIDNLTTISRNDNTNDCVNDDSDPLTLSSSCCQFDNHSSLILNASSSSSSSSSSSWWEEDENWRPFQGSLQELELSSNSTTMNPSTCPKNVGNMVLVFAVAFLSVYSIFITILYFRGRKPNHVVSSSYHRSKKQLQRKDMSFSKNIATKQSTVLQADAHEESYIIDNEKTSSTENNYMDAHKECEKAMLVSKAQLDKPMIMATSHNEEWFVQQVRSLTTTFSSTGLNRQDSIQLANSTVLKKLELEYMVSAYNYHLLFL